MKNSIKYILQKMLGYQRYLRIFSNYKIRTLENDVKENDFFQFLDAIETDGILLDVGANIGIMTYHLAKKFPHKEVVAIEPMPDNFLTLQAMVQQKKLVNVTLIQCAVGSQKEVLKMVLPLNGRVKMQGLAHVVHNSIAEWNEGEQIDVICDTLDHLAAAKRVAGIKMDIENFEFFALQGATEILKNDQPVIYLELWANENRKKCFELLYSFGYRAYVTNNNVLTPYDEKVHQKQNFIFKAVAV